MYMCVHVYMYIETEMCVPRMHYTFYEYTYIYIYTCIYLHVYYMCRCIYRERLGYRHLRKQVIYYSINIYICIYIFKCMCVYVYMLDTSKM